MYEIGCINPTTDEVKYVCEYVNSEVDVAYNDVVSLSRKNPTLRFTLDFIVPDLVCGFGGAVEHRTTYQNGRAIS